MHLLQFTASSNLEAMALPNPFDADAMRSHCEAAGFERLLQEAVLAHSLKSTPLPCPLGSAAPPHPFEKATLPKPRGRLPSVSPGGRLPSVSPRGRRHTGTSPRGRRAHESHRGHRRAHASPRMSPSPSPSHIPLRQPPSHASSMPDRSFGRFEAAALVCILKTAPLL